MKNKINNSDELDLIELSILIWNEKLKIFLITILISLIGFSYNFFNNKKINTSDEKLFELSLKIYPTSNPHFFQFINTIDAMKNSAYKSQSIIINPTHKYDKDAIFDRFTKELMDYDEIVSVLSNNPDFLDNIENLTERNKKIELYKYAKLLTIRKTINTESEPLTYYLKFEWFDENQGIQILRDTLNLALKNLEEEIFRELDDYFELNKYLVVNKDLNKINFLISQLKIAKELNIQSNANIKNSSIPYYLFGYEAIEREIDNLKNRKYPQIAYLDDLYKKLKNTGDNKWVGYNLLTISIENLSIPIDEKSLVSVVSILKLILFGLIIGIIFVLIFNKIQSRKSYRRK